LELRAAIVGGWHIYSITQMPGGPTRTVISLPDRQPFQKEGAVTGPKPDKSFDPNFSLDTETYEGAIRFSVPVRTAKDAVAGKAKIAVDVLFQSCNDTTCLPPHTTHLFAPIHIEQRLPASSARSTAPLPSKPPAAPGVAAQ
jgi:thiol:disulfide interchange protein DsbD